MSSQPSLCVNDFSSLEVFLEKYFQPTARHSATSSIWNESSIFVK